jgi:hypothetical protein
MKIKKEMLKEILCSRSSTVYRHPTANPRHPTTRGESPSQKRNAGKKVRRQRKNNNPFSTKSH